MEKKNDKIVGAVFIIALVLGGILLLQSRTPGNNRLALNPSRSDNQPIRLLKVVDEENPPNHSKGLVRYKNTETRKISWDYEHYLPTEIVITRESLQLP
jgi:hypothetical protein